MQEYVLVHCRDRTRPDHILILYKDRPRWQAGRINLPGGHVEPGETPVVAAIRELEEETGYRPNFRYGTNGPLYIHKMGEITFDGGIVHCMDTVLTTEVQGPPKPQEGETQIAEWVQWGLLNLDPRLIPNLRVIVPLMRYGVQGWSITDNDSSLGLEKHGLSISVPTHYTSPESTPIPQMS